MPNKKQVPYLHEFRSNHLFLLDFHYILVSLSALFMAILFHELGHYLAALYYGLNPIFGINFGAIYVKTSFLDSRTHEIISHAGPIANLVVVFLASILLYIRGHKRDMHDYVYSILFIILITNLLVALVSLILFPFSGIL